MEQRSLPYKPKPSATVQERIAETLSTTMYLVQTIGPTCYLIKEQGSEAKFKVRIGSLQMCSCGNSELCRHILFVMLKVFRVPQDNPLVWQTALLDTEVTRILRRDFSRDQRRTVNTTRHVSYLRAKKMPNQSSETQTPDDDPGVERHQVVEEENCVICQEDMMCDKPLTYCKKGCGNNFHVECMKVYAENCRQSHNGVKCPLCRKDWGNTAATELSNEVSKAKRAPNVHRGSHCRSCKSKPIYGSRYRCIRCCRLDLCRRCFEKGIHSKHPFIVKEVRTSQWEPAARQTAHSNLSEMQIEELQNREITQQDYDLLLELDASRVGLPGFLLKHLPGTTIYDGKSSLEPQTDPCSLCHHSLKISCAIQKLPCDHIFHQSCMLQQLTLRSYECPECKLSLFKGLTNQKKAKENPTFETPKDDGLQITSKGIYSSAKPHVVSPMQLGPSALSQNDCAPELVGTLVGMSISGRGKQDPTTERKNLTTPARGRRVPLHKGLLLSSKAAPGVKVQEPELDIRCENSSPLENLRPDPQRPKNIKAKRHHARRIPSNQVDDALSIGCIDKAVQNEPKTTDQKLRRRPKRDPRKSNDTKLPPIDLQVTGNLRLE